MNTKWLNIALIIVALLIITFKLITKQDFNRNGLIIAIFFIIINIIGLFKKRSTD